MRQADCTGELARGFAGLSLLETAGLQSAMAERRIVRDTVAPDSESQTPNVRYNGRLAQRLGIKMPIGK